jgi:alpha-L-fucosidase
MKNKLHFLAICTILFCIQITQNVSAQYTIPQKMNWWYEARFGMFIHFGSYSYLGHGEWVLYAENWSKEDYQSQVTANFNPVNFNAGTIARLAKNAGMKYLVITAKHHEGFCMWPTEVESFKDVTGTKMFSLQGFTNFGSRDIMQELKDSCDAVGIKFCLYYSILDWEHSSQTKNSDYYSTMESMTARADYINDMKAQLKELIEKYHPHIMWFDGDWTGNTGDPTLSSWWTKNDGIALYDTLIKLDPNLIVNERVFRNADLGDYECPEQTVPDTALDRPWETNQTMNTSWGYNSSDNSYKTATTLVQQLVDVVSKDGNYLLNIGPKGDGTVPDEQISLLTQIGDWTSVYGNSIYGSTRSPFSETPSWGRYTKKEGKLFAHVFSWPSNSILKVYKLTNTVEKIYLMNDSTNLLNYKDSIGYYWISVPQNAPNEINSVVVIEVNGTPTASTEYTKVSKIIIYGEGEKISISGIGKTLQMQSIVMPKDATDKTLTWSVSDNTIASVSTTGLLTAKKEGKVTVTATANDGSDILGQTQIIVGNVTQGENLLQNSDFETQDSGWEVVQCDASGSINVTYENSNDGPLYGAGNYLRLQSDKGATNQVFVYQKVAIQKGHTYMFSAAMKEKSPTLTDDWISLVYTTEKPVENQDVAENTISSFGSWMSCTGASFDGLIENSCASSSAYFTIPETVTSDSVYFGINVGTWGTSCAFDLYFDNITLRDTALEVTSIPNNVNTRSFNSSLKVFPNPCDKGLVKIEYENTTSNEVCYSIVNVLGDVVKTGVFTNEISLDLSCLKKGIYLIKVLDNEKSTVQKLIKL